MDIEATLARMRTLVAGCLATGYDDDRPTDEWTQDALEALELVTGLDEHLSRGGYLPEGWTR